MLILDRGPALCSLHHATAVQSSEPEPMVDVVTASVDRPAVFFVVWNARRLYDDVLDVAPRQVSTEKKTRASASVSKQ